MISGGYIMLYPLTITMCGITSIVIIYHLKQTSATITYCKY